MGNNLSSLLDALDERTRRGHEYSGITISGQARVQNGDTYQIQNYYSRHVPSPDSIIRGSRAKLSFEESGWPRKRKRVAGDDNEGQILGREGCSQLDRAVAHLGELAMSLKDQKKDGDAQRILQWIRLLLDALEDGDSMSLSQHTGDEIATLQKGLLRADRVMVNSTPLSRRKAFSQVTETTRKRSVIKLGKWKICLDTLICKSLDGERRDVIDSYSSLRLDALSSKSAVTNSIAAFFGETTEYNQKTVMHPTILAYRVVDSNSEIFRLVERDDLQGLIGMLAEQRATVRDCDQEGRSLLHYASYYCSPDCCRYLVGVGADVDRIEWGFQEHEREHLTSLSTAVCQALDHVFFAQGHTHAVECTKVLIEAGADSTTHEVNDHGDSISAISQMIAYASDLQAVPNDTIEDISSERDSALEGPRYFDLVLRGAFDDLKTLVSEDGSLWLDACRQPVPWMLQKLLGAGCDCTETKCRRREGNVDLDNEIGFNGLFFVVLYSFQPGSSDGLESLQVLLDASADPFARDEAGLTLFDHVERHNDPWIGSYQRDLWYCALHRAGIDASAYLHQYPRRANYTRSYTPYHYRAMCSLDHWNKGDLDYQVEQTLADRPWSVEEVEALSAMTRWDAAYKRQSEENDRRRDKWFKKKRVFDVDHPSVNEWQQWDEEMARRYEWEDHRYGSDMWFQERTLEEYMALDREWEEEGIAWRKEHRKGESRVVEVDSDEDIDSDEEDDHIK